MRSSLWAGAAQLALAIVGLARTAYAAEVALPRAGSAKHIGVQRCNSGTCHGGGSPAAESHSYVRQDEWTTWVNNKQHSRAFEDLQTPGAQKIAKKLQIKNAAESPVCLNCHADNVPPDRRDVNFTLNTGVSCESCHGGASSWIDDHKARTADHRQNIAAGMFPTDQPRARARLCLSCHLGTKDQFPNHLIMAAGHKPLQLFELGDFNFEQQHFNLDKDYIGRKREITPIKLWLAGQIESARQLASLARSQKFFRPAGSLFPELALYDCYSCHHTYEKARWTKGGASAGTRPGTLRLQTQNLVVLWSALQVLDPVAAKKLANLTTDLVLAGQRGVEDVSRAAGAVVEELAALDPLVEPQREISRNDVVAVRKALLKSAAAEEAADYATAEQVFYGINGLTEALGDQKLKRSSLDGLRKAVNSEATFDPKQFADLARAAAAKF